MNAALYRRVNEVLESALELPPAERSAFVEQACGTDADLRAEVESMLKHAEEVPSSFMASPILGPDGGASTVNAHSQAATIDYVPAAPAKADGYPDIAGYRILKTLGRGGMGVVYLAQDLKLPRQVALKMIRTGVDADEMHLRRFQAEAAAVAQLVHPNIVQIHEIKEHAGNPFFVLEYVGGGTLTRKINHLPMKPEEAAQIVLVLAKAMQAAHQRGIIHRDLKPSNVLLTTDGTPKITDFGLAKHLDADQGISQAGDIMGTPSYMAPEQAAGKIEDLGTACDIYALGAILYEALTGQPPFKGESTLATLEMVRHQEPAAIRDRYKDVPGNLETICLKCLRKDPRDRYSSALALAQDLERFLAGEAILARPEGLPAKVWRRVRRNRAASSLVAALVLVSLVAGFIIYRTRDASRYQDLLLRIEQESEWTEAKIQEHEARIAQMGLNAERTVDAKGKLVQAILDSARQRLRTQGSLQPEAKQYVELVLREVSKRNDDAGRTLAREYDGRLRAWEQAFPTIQSPKKADLNKQEFANTPRPAKTLLTDKPCKGNVQVEAVWDNWKKAGQIGVTLHGSAEAGAAGYAFVIEVPPESGKTRFEELSPAKDAVVQIQILRNGVALKKERIPIGRLGEGRIRISGERVDDRLTFLLENRVVLEARDLVPLRPGGYFGVVLGDSATLQYLAGRQQALPIKPGKLEEGDDLYARGNFAKAQEYYAKQAIDLLGTPEGLEARFKNSLALESLGQRESAIRGYETLVKEGGKQSDSKWVFLALFQLWIDQLRDKNHDRADAMLNKLLNMKGYGKKEGLILFIPEDLRNEVIHTYTSASGGLGFWRYDPNRLINARRVVDIEELLEVPAVYRGWSQRALLRVLRTEGGLTEAAQLVQTWLKELPPQDDVFGVIFTTEFGWIMREKGTLEPAMREVNRRLMSEDNSYRPKNMSLLIERARLHAAMKNWAAAEKDVRLFLDEAPDQQKHYRHLSDAYLLLGLFLEAQGKLDDAVQAWKKGRYTGNLDNLDLGANTAGGIGLINVLLLDSLCREASPERIESLVRNILRDQQTALQMLNRFDAKGVFLSASRIANRVWYTPRGKDALRRMALQTCSFDEYVRLPYQALATEFLADEALVEKITPEQEALLWDMSEKGWNAYKKGAVTEVQLAELVYIWKKGPVPFFGIAALKNLKDKELRGPGAYFLGLRFQRMGLPTEELFRIAVADASENSPLQRLARTELAKTGKKK